MAIQFISGLSVTGNSEITGTLSVSSITADNSTYTGIMVWDGGVLKYRTKAQILNDIGATGNLGTVTSVTVQGSSGLSGSGTVTSSGTITLTNSDKGSSQAIYKNIATQSGTATANSNNDTLTITGTGGTTTSRSGDTITINSTDNNDNYYVTGLSFSTSDGILTASRNGGLSSLTADLDGRYAEGTGANTRVAFWTGTNSISSDSGLVWNSSSNYLGVNKTPGTQVDVSGNVRVDGLDNFLYLTSTNDIYSFGSSTQTMANPPNAYLWHDLFAFEYNYSVTQETYNGTSWSSATVQNALFAQKEDQSVEVISSSNTAVRWTFTGTAWGSALFLNVAFTYSASDITKEITVESSTNNSTWTTRFSGTATAGTSTKTCRLTGYGGDNYIRVTIQKGTSSTNSVRMSQIRLMTLRAGDQGQGREYELPITWDADRNIGINKTPSSSYSYQLNVNGTAEISSYLRLGAGVRLSESTDRSDLLYINSETSGWGGLQIGNTSNEFIFSLMGDGSTGGIYDDQQGEWLLQWIENSEVRLYYDGAERLNTSSAGVTVTGDLTVTGGDIVLNGTGRITGVDTVSAGTDAANKTYVDNAVSGSPQGTVTSVTTMIDGDAITISGGSTQTITTSGTFDLEFTGASTDYINGEGILTSFPTIPTVNNGTLTMTTSTGLDGGATFTANQSGNSAFAVTLDLSELTDMTAGMTATDEFIVLDSGAERRKAAGEIGLSIFNNDSNFITSASLPTVNNAAITIEAGTNLTTGGTFTTNQGIDETITINMATGGIGSGTYGTTSNSNKIDNITVDAYGRVTAVTTGATGQVNLISSGNTNTLTKSGTTSVTLTPNTGTVSSSSTKLATGAQIQTAIDTALTGVLQFVDTWNASTNSPQLSSGTGTSGDYYIVSVAGSTNLDGITDWAIGDWAVFANTTWTKIDNSQVGNVTGSGSSGRIAVWNSASNITSDSGLTFNTSSNALTVSGAVTWSGGGSAESNSAYDNMITAFSDSGSSTITLTLTQQDGGTLTTSFSNPQGTVTGVRATTDGNSLGLSGTVSTNGTLELPWQGTTSQYVRGDGSLNTFPAIPSVGNGQINGATSGNGLSGSMSATANQSGNSTFTVTSNATTAATASTIAYRDSSADLNVRLLRANYANQSTISGAIAFRVNNSTDNYTRYCSSPSAIRAFIGAGTSSTTGTVTSVGISHGGNAFEVGSAVTSSGTLAITMAGDSAQYVRGDGNLASFPNIPQGDITAVVAGTNLSGGGTSGSVTLNMATGGAGAGSYGSTSNSTKIDTITLDAYGRVTAVNTGSTGDIDGVSAGAGLSGGGTSGTPTLSVDYLGTDSIIKAAPTASGAVGTGDFLLIANSVGNVFETTMSNLPFTNNLGDITGVTAGTGMSGGGTSGTVTLNCTITNNNQLTNGAGYTTNVGDITGVTAGSGLTGGGSSGGVTLNVDYGSSGIIADCPGGSGEAEIDDLVMIGLDSSGGGETRAFTLADLPFMNRDNTSVTNWTVLSTLNVRGVIDLADNDILRFGTGDDVEMFFSGTDMFMDINNGEDFKIRDGNSGNATRFTFDADNGNFTATGNITAFSDERLKDNIETLDGSKVLDMRGVSYTKDGKAGSGVIAQEIEKVAPELVMTNEKEDGMKSVAYGNLVGYLIEAVKDQQKQIDELKLQLDGLSK